MSEADSCSDPELPHLALRGIDAICDRFEALWKEGHRPPIEDFLSGADELPHNELLKQLLLVEFDYRSREGEDPQLHEYQKRFAGFNRAVESAFNTPSEETANHTDDTSRLSLAGTWREGDCIGRFCVVRLLGGGAFGIVYLANDPTLERDVALKVPRTGSILDEREARRFLGEAKAAGRLYHRNIVSVYDAGQLENTLYIASEYISGPTLDEQLKEGVGRSFSDSAKLIIKLADALEYAHQQKVIHRDVKPGNVLIDGQGEPHLTDFGLARRDIADSLRTQHGELIGTPAYMSPEQARGDGYQADGRADIWSLGVMLYELLCGERPFAGSLRQTLDRIAKEPPRPLRQRNPTVPRDLETICLKCLEHDPQDRYQTGAELADDLQRWLRMEPIRACPIGWTGRSWRWYRRNRMVATLMLAIFCAVGLGAFFTSSERLSADRFAQESESKGRALKEKQRELRTAHSTNEAAQRQLNQDKYCVAISEAKRALADGRHSDAARDLGTVSQELPGWEWHRLMYETRRRPQLNARLSAHEFGVIDGAIAPSGQRAATIGIEGLLLVWDLNGPRLERTLTDGQWSHELRRWQHPVETLRENKEHRLTQLTQLCWLDSERLLTVALSGEVKIWNIETGTAAVLVTIDEALWSVAAANERTVLAGGASGRGYRITLSEDSVGKVEQSETPKLPSSVTAIHAAQGSREWIIGCLDGTVAVMDQAAHAILSQTQVPGPVWELALADTSRRTELAVACGMSELPRFQLVSGTRRLISLTSFASTTSTSTAVEFRAVSYSADQREIWGWGSNGELVSFAASTGRPKWRLMTADQDFRARSRLTKLAEHLGDVPLPLRRTNGLLVPLSTNQRFIAAGHDSMLQVWRLPNADRLWQSEKTTDIVFDREAPGRLWIASRNRPLRAIDTRSDRTWVSSDETTTAVALAWNSAARCVLSADVEGQLRQWQLKGDEIVEVGRPLSHTAPLRSLASSHHGETVAGVDSFGQLVVWDWTTQAPIFTELLAVEGNLNTGRLAFSEDDSRLAAFGPGQTCAVFDTSNWHPLHQSPNVGGSGGTAILWPRPTSDFLLISDDHARFATARFTDNLDSLQQRYKSAFSLQNPPVSCLAMASTPMPERWFFLYSDGRLECFDPGDMGVMCEWPTGCRNAIDIELDPQETSVAIATAEEIVVLESNVPTRPTPPQAGSKPPKWTWASAEFPLERDKVVGLPAEGAYVLDRFGRLAMLCVERDADARAGRLVLLRETSAGEIQREVIEGRPLASQQAVALALTSNGALAIGFRANQIANQYDAVLHYLVEKPQGGWQREIVIDQGNVGIFPNYALGPSQRMEAFDFNYENFYWVHRVRGETGWVHQTVGRQGDGLRPQMARGPDASLHFIFRTQRSNANVSEWMYARWNGKTLDREIFSPWECEVIGIHVEPQGTPCVLTHSGEGLALVKRLEEGWHSEPVPIPANTSRFAACSAMNPQGDIYIATTNHDLKQSDLWIPANGQWQRISLDLDTIERECVIWLGLDANDSPVLIAGRSETAGARLRVLRRVAQKRTPVGNGSRLQRRTVTLASDIPPN